MVPGWEVNYATNVLRSRWSAIDLCFCAPYEMAYWMRLIITWHRARNTMYVIITSSCRPTEWLLFAQVLVVQGVNQRSGLSRRLPAFGYINRQIFISIDWWIAVGLRFFPPFNLHHLLRLHAGLNEMKCWAVSKSVCPGVQSKVCTLLLFSGSPSA